jgi:hypothetical protein
MEHRPKNDARDEQDDDVRDARPARQAVGCECQDQQTAQKSEERSEIPVMN